MGGVYLGYGLPAFFRDGLFERGATVVDAALDEDFLLGNARLTALATVGHLFMPRDRSPEELSVGVVGYGRIGRALVRCLLALGVCVRVYSTRESAVHCLCASGVDAELVKVGDPIPEVDILINTAPSQIFDVATPTPTGTDILELASGENFPGRKITRLPALPLRYFPVSAGRLYGEALLRALGV